MALDPHESQGTVPQSSWVRSEPYGDRALRRSRHLDDLPRRRAFFDRFVHSQRFAQVDPWSERFSGKDKHEFKPMAVVGYQEAAE